MSKKPKKTTIKGLMVHHLGFNTEVVDTLKDKKNNGENIATNILNLTNNENNCGHVGVFKSTDDNKLTLSTLSNSTYITTGTDWSYNPSSTIRYTGDSGEVHTIPLDEIAYTVDAIDEKIEKKLEEHNGTKPILDRLDIIIKKLELIDKKYLRNAMHDELKDLMSEVNKYREEKK